MEFLGLEPCAPAVLVERPSRSIFIAHRFDDTASALADRLARFLNILGFDVKTGRGYAPRSVSDKVRERLEQQAVVVALRTKGEDDTWLIQESILADSRGKPLIIIKELGADFKSGLLADLEYIAFQAPHIEQALVPLLGRTA
jgi:hypothetical protein